MGSTIWVDGPGSRLAVYVSGASTDPVVLLHGGPGVPDYLAPVSEARVPPCRAPGAGPEALHGLCGHAGPAGGRTWPTAPSRRMPRHLGLNPSNRSPALLPCATARLLPILHPKIRSSVGLPIP